jgi:putative ABC transport system substrate-binding protein
VRTVIRVNNCFMPACPRALIRFFFAIALGCTSPPGMSQTVPHTPRVGVLYMGTEDKSGGFEQGMRELGYAPGQNVVLEYRYAEGRPERLPALAAQLVSERVDVILAAGPGPLAAVRRATTKIPIVTVAGSDPVLEGWAKTLARPAGIVTGLSVTFPELQQKRLEIMKELLPSASRIAVVMAPLEFPDGGDAASRDIGAAAKIMGLQLHWLPVRSVADLDELGDALRQGRGQAVFTVETTFVASNRRRIAEIAAQQGIPVIGEFTVFGADEVLIAHGANINDLLRRAAKHVDRILRGAQAGDLPVERPTKIDLTVNQRVARGLGITIPRSILLRADQVID